MRRGGPPRGRRQHSREPSYDPTSGRPYRPGTSFQPRNAAKLLDLTEAAGDMSVSGFLDLLIEAVPVDPETGLPPFWPQLTLGFTVPQPLRADETSDEELPTAS